MDFGRLQIVPETREIYIDGVSMKLGSRAFELAHLLVEAQGKLVTKEDIIQRVWNGTIVEENSIQVAVSTLRKALGTQRERIRTVSGRGYQLLAEPQARLPATDLNNLPVATSDLIGRATALQEIEQLARKHRIVTLTGAGGIGKTRLGLEASRRLMPQFADGAWLADFGPLSDAMLVTHKVAATLGLEVADNLVSPERIAALVASRHLLLLLDNCEHVIDAVAELTDALTRASSNLQIITTSREPLRARGEGLYRVSSLSVPLEEGLSCEAMLSFGAIELFVARAQATDRTFLPDEKSLAAIALICRRLDGMPLAIELAAARSATLGINALAARLDEQFRLLTGGFRTALPRHRTLIATLDWSYDLLNEGERHALCSLAILAGAFTLPAASVIARVEGSPEDATLDNIDGLTTKSLIVTDIQDGKIHYRLLETTRAYALLKLTESGNFRLLARRHAQLCVDILNSREHDWQGHAARDTLPMLKSPLANIAMALKWSFSPEGDPPLGVSLTTAAVPLWMHLSMTKEARQFLDRALAVAETDQSIEDRQKMRLNTAFGMVLVSQSAPAIQVREKFSKALEIAERLNDADYRLRALWGLCTADFYDGEFHSALRVARLFYGFAAASGDPSALRSGEILLGASLHVGGKQLEAKRHIDRLLEGPEYLGNQPSSSRFLYNRRASGLSLLSAILWVTGYPEQAKRKLQQAIEEALSKNHVVSLCTVLGNGGCTQALFRGDLAEAEHLLGMLVEHAEKYDLRYWKSFARCVRGALFFKRGDPEQGLHFLQTGFENLADRANGARCAPLRAYLAEALGCTAKFGEALAIVDAAIQSAERSGQQVTLPNFFRLKGELIHLQKGAAAVPEAEGLFRNALELSREQDSRATELRAANSLALLRHFYGRPPDSLDVLKKVYGSFTEGFDTTDLILARRLLNAEGLNRETGGHGGDRTDFRGPNSEKPGS